MKNSPAYGLVATGFAIASAVDASGIVFGILSLVYVALSLLAI